MIAAHNRSDGGLSAVLQATLEYQRGMSAQLMSIQLGLKEVLAQVSALPPKFKEILRLQRLTTLHAEIGGAAVRYKEEAVRASTFGSYQAWVADSLTKSRLTDINNQLDRAIAEIARGRWLDPVTAIYLPVGLNLSLAVRVALGEARPQLRAEAQRYLDLFDLVQDRTEVGSTAAELVTRQSKYANISGALLKKGFRLPATATESSTIALALPVTIQDYVAPTPASQICKTHLARTVDAFESCVVTQNADAGRTGPSQRFAFIVDVNQSLLWSGISGTEAFAIRQFAAPGPSRIVDYRETDYDPATVPPAPTAQPADAATPAARLAAVTTLGNSALAEAKRVALSAQLDELNVEIAQIALCLSSLAATASARTSAFQAFDRSRSS